MTRPLIMTPAYDGLKTSNEIHAKHGHTPYRGFGAIRESLTAKIFNENVLTAKIFNEKFRG